MPPKKRKYPDYCYDIIEEDIDEGRGARTARKRLHYFENQEKIAQYRREHDLDRLEAIQEKKKAEAAKKREEERKKKAEAAKNKKPKKRTTGRRRKPKKKPEAGESPPEEEVIEFLEEEEEDEELKEIKRWEKEDEELARREKEQIARRKEQKRREEEGEDDLDDFEEVEEEGQEIIEEDEGPSLEDYFRMYDEEREQIRRGNNTNTDISELQDRIQNAIEVRRVQTEIEEDGLDDVPVAESIYAQRQSAARKQLRRDIKEERRSNYLITVVSNANLRDYTPEEIEVLAAEMQYRINEKLYLYAPDYIRFLEKNDSLDLITRVELFTKPERQEGRGRDGQLHTHSILATTHHSKIRLDYEMIHELMQEVARDMKFSKRKDGGIAKFQVQIQRASDSAQGEYEYLAEDGVTYESGDISNYYEQAEAAIREGSMNREDLLKFKRRKKEVASAQKQVRELRGQRFG